MSQRWIYHITHLVNLASIGRDGLLSDASRIAAGLDVQLVGMSETKRRRLEEIAVDCCGGRKVGESVPFYFCPRSVMLFVIHRGNHPDLGYHGGQGSIIHLATRVSTVTDWACSNGGEWAFSPQNAGNRFATFSQSLEELEGLDWRAISNTNFTEPRIKAAKQAEFLVHDRVPWNLIEGIEVQSERHLSPVQEVLQGMTHRPKVVVRPNWYF